MGLGHVKVGSRDFLYDTLLYHLSGGVLQFNLHNGKDVSC